MAIERNKVYFRATEKLIHFGREAEKLGTQAKESLLEILKNDLPDLPKIRAYNRQVRGSNYEEIEALPIERGGLGKDIDRLTIKAPDPTPVIAMTHEGVYRAPIQYGRVGTYTTIYVADWENKKELSPIEYLLFTPKILEAIRLEYESRPMVNSINAPVKS